MKKALLSLPTVLLATALVTTACGGSSGSGSSPATSASPDNGFSKGKFDPPITMTTVGCLNSTFKFKNGETLENNIHTKWVKENLGIELKYNWVSADDQCKTKMRLDMSAGTKMPDIMYTGDQQLASDLIDSGQFMDITEVFNKYASQQVKDIYNQDPLYWANVTRNGKKMGLPTLARAYQNDPVLWLRTDWLQKMNLQTPKTFDELEKVMETMMKTDFGTGPVNPPLAVSIKDSNAPFVQWRGDTSWVFGGYGVIPHFWNTWNKGDKLQYGSIQPETKQGLAKMAEWFKKGYLSPDIALIEVGKSDDTFRNQKSGIMTGPMFQAAIVRQYLQKNNPNATAAPIALPTGPSGKAGRRDTTIAGTGFLINKDFKHPEAFFLYINKMYEIENPPKGSPFEFGYHEGYDYVLKDGKPTSVEADFPDKMKVNPVKYFLGSQPFVDPLLELKTNIKFYNGELPATPYESKIYNAIPESERKNPKQVNEWLAAKIVYDQKDTVMKNLFTGPQTETMKSKWEALVKMESETFLKIVYGKAPIDEFDNFVKNWKSMGGDKITEEVNAWYKTATGK